MALLEGPRGLEDHVCEVGPCRSCTEAHKDDPWEWGRCMTPTIENARLISAAPDLLAACEAALGAFTNANAIDWSDLERAIAKAKGQ